MSVSYTHLDVYKRQRNYVYPEFTVGQRSAVTFVYIKCTIKIITNLEAGACTSDAQSHGCSITHMRVVALGQQRHYAGTLLRSSATHTSTFILLMDTT